MTRDFASPTLIVMKLAARVGEVVMMRLKRHFNKHHAHAILSNPVAGCRARPFGLSPPPPPHRSAVNGDRSDGKSNFSAPLEIIVLAANIGLNRVIAGFHFRYQH